MDYFLELFVSGLTRGSIYALIALGYTMVYGLLELINFAHGEIYMLGAFTGLIAAALLSFAGLPPAGGPAPAAGAGGAGGRAWGAGGGAALLLPMVVLRVDAAEKTVSWRWANLGWSAAGCFALALAWQARGLL